MSTGVLRLLFASLVARAVGAGVASEQQRRAKSATLSVEADGGVRAVQWPAGAPSGVYGGAYVNGYGGGAAPGYADAAPADLPPSVQPVSPGLQSAPVQQQKKCTIPQWQIDEWICKEHEAVSKENIWKDGHNHKRKNMESGDICTVVCPGEASWMSPSVADISCEDGEWLNSATKKTVPKITCGTSGSVKLLFLAVVAGAAYYYYQYYYLPAQAAKGVEGGAPGAAGDAPVAQDGVSGADGGTVPQDSNSLVDAGASSSRRGSAAQ